MAGKCLAIFDFDGTLTTKDSFLQFLVHAFGGFVAYFKLAISSPWYLGYKLRLISNEFAKQKIFSYFFKNYSNDTFMAMARDYSLTALDSILRPDAIKKLQWHKSQGHKIIVISASLEAWLLPWCQRLEIDLIATKHEVKNDHLTGRFSTRNCYGQEKVNRLKAYLDLSNFDDIFVYGDSAGDRELFGIATKKFLKRFS